MNSIYLYTFAVASFREIAKTVAANWKAIDPITKTYVVAVATLLKRRYKELQGMGCLTVGSRSPTSSSAVSPPAPSLASSRALSPTSGTGNVRPHLKFQSSSPMPRVSSQTMAASASLHEAREDCITANFVRSTSLSSSTHGYCMDTVEANYCVPSSSNETRGTDQETDPFGPNISFSLPNEIFSRLTCMNSDGRAFEKKYHEVDVSDRDIMSFYKSIWMFE